MKQLGLPIEEVSISVSELDKYWDYPIMYTKTLDHSAILKKIEFDFKTLKVKRMCGVLIHPIPEHLPIKYILVCQAAIKRETFSSSQNAREILEDATREVKAFTDVLSMKAKYRPKVWFIKDSKDIRPIEGTLTSTIFPPDLPAYVERMFSPLADYIVYGVDPEHEQLQKRIPDLSLVLLVPHLLERGYRVNLLSVFEEAREILKNLPETIPKESEELKAVIHDLYKVSDELRVKRQKMTKIHEMTIRVDGMVRRIKQKNGGYKTKNFFDIICSDCFAVLDIETDALIGAIRNWIDSVKDLIDAASSKITHIHNALMQSVGWGLEAVASAFVVFQILDKILPYDNYKPFYLAISAFISAVAFYTYLNPKWKKKVKHWINCKHFESKRAFRQVD